MYIFRREVLKKIVYNFPVIGRYLKFRVTPYYESSFLKYFVFRFIKIDKSIYWPRTKTNVVTNPKCIVIGKNASIGAPGCYIQGGGRLVIGNYVRVAMNVGIMSGGHDTLDHKKNIENYTEIGDYSWIGMNSVILPGVKLGPRTIVGAGAVVTQSFPDGFCVLAGNPAKLVKLLDRKKFVPVKEEYEFYGYVPVDKFDKFQKRHFHK